MALPGQCGAGVSFKGKVSQLQRFFLYQETQHCGWEKRISAYAAIIYRVGLSHSCKCVLAWERIRACTGKDLGQTSTLSLNRCSIGSHSLFFLYQADNFSAGKNKHRRMPPVTRESQGLSIFHRASIPLVYRVTDAANPAAARKPCPLWSFSYVRCSTKRGEADSLLF